MFDPKPSLLSAKEIPLFTGWAPSWLSCSLVDCLEGRVCHSRLHKGSKASFTYHCRGECPNCVRFSDNWSSLGWESFWNEDTLSSETEGAEVNFPFSRWHGPSVNMECTFQGCKPMNVESLVHSATSSQVSGLPYLFALVFMDLFFHRLSWLLSIPVRVFNIHPLPQLPWWRHTFFKEHFKNAALFKIVSWDWQPQFRAIKILIGFYYRQNGFRLKNSS